MRIRAFCPTLTSAIDVSSTLAFNTICDRSATSMITVPALFIVPVTTNSPTSALSRVTTPSIGEVIVV
jgi:hypothetical protein